MRCWAHCLGHRCCYYHGAQGGRRQWGYRRPGQSSQVAPFVSDALSALGLPGPLPMSTAVSGLLALKIITRYKILPSFISVPWCCKFQCFTVKSEWLTSLTFLDIFGSCKKTYAEVFLTEKLLSGSCFPLPGGMLSLLRLQIMWLQIEGLELENNFSLYEIWSFSRVSFPSWI